MKIEELAVEIINASLFWTGQDEEQNPGLKRIRTLADLILNPINYEKELCCSCGYKKFRHPADQLDKKQCTECHMFYYKDK